MTTGTEQAGGTGASQPMGGRGGDQAQMIQKIVNDVSARLDKNLGDHPNVNKANLWTALQTKLQGQLGA